MSGFVGIWNLDGAPVDRALLDRMTRALAFRGPDTQEVWCQGAVGLGHAFLQIRGGAGPEKQLGQLDGRLWIVADARIDGRADLIAKLKTKSQAAGILSLAASDAELILHSYEVWGESCPEHLLGDFSFAIWDSERQKMFCARDQFGMRLFFYARVGNSFLFSNTLDCLRLHPGISDRLNDLAIADFLMFETNMDMSTTTFADIMRLPPAHSMFCTSKGPAIRRYWTLPEEPARQYRRQQDCIDEFNEVFDAAVSDRIPGNSASILLSGGLDSSTVAVSARRTTGRRIPVLDLKGFTAFHEKLIPDEEKYYATLVGKALDISLEYLDLDDCDLYDSYEDPEYRTSEPSNDLMSFRLANGFRKMSFHSRIALTGFGADPALGSLLSVHFIKLYQAGQFGRMISDAMGFLTSEGRISRLYWGVRMRRLFHPDQKLDQTPLPAWLNPDMVKRLNLQERWESLAREVHPNRSARPEGYESTASSHWTALFQSYDAQETGLTLEFVHPFFDLRVLKFLLGLPALPWASDKEILRRATRGCLPEAVRLRKKTTLSVSPIPALLERPEMSWLDHFEPVPELRQHVILERVPKVCKMNDAFGALVSLRPLSLNFWLQRRSNIRYK